MARPAAFLPSTKDRETSVSRHGAEPSERLWIIGLQSAGERNLYGAAIFKAGLVQKAQLDLLAHEPPARHAVIRGWPWLDSDPELQRAQQKERALVISSEAVLLLR